MGNIWARNGQVLKGANKRSIESRITERRTINSQVLEKQLWGSTIETQGRGFKIRAMTLL